LITQHEELRKYVPTFYVINTEDQYIIMDFIEGTHLESPDIKSAKEAVDAFTRFGDKQEGILTPDGSFVFVDLAYILPADWEPTDKDAQ
jgi:hypothetical protein